MAFIRWTKSKHSRKRTGRGTYSNFSEYGKLHVLSFIGGTAFGMLRRCAEPTWTEAVGLKIRSAGFRLLKTALRAASLVELKTF
jgi:hypothetical protein